MQDGKQPRPLGLRTLLSDSALFGLVGVSDRIIGFLVLPITARLLGAANFGILSLFVTTGTVLLAFTGLMMPTAFFRFYTERSYEWTSKSVLETAFWVINWAAAASILLLLVFSRPLSEFLFGRTSLALVGLLCIKLYAGSISALASSRMQAEGAAKKYAKLQILNGLMTRAASLGLLLLGYGLEGVIYGEVLGGLIGAALISKEGLRGALPRAHARTLRALAPYGIALIPGFISEWLMVGTDKYMLRAMFPNDLELLGLYSVGERFAAAMSLGAFAFTLGYRRFAFVNMHIEQGGRFIARGVSLYVLFAGYFGLVIAMLGDDCIHWLLGAEFEGGAVVVPALTGAYFFAGLQRTLRIGLLKEKRAGLLSSIDVGGAFSNVLINLALIPVLGILGAALATFVTQVLMTIVVWIVSQRHYAIPLEYARLARIALLYSVVYAVGLQFLRFGWATAGLAQVVLCLMLPLGMAINGLSIVSAEERSSAIAGLRDVRSRLRR